MPVNVSPTGAENADAENAPAIANTSNFFLFNPLFEWNFLNCINSLPQGKRVFFRLSLFIQVHHKNGSLRREWLR